MMSGIPIAVKTTLRGPAMFSFLSMLAEVVLPRVKDFDGVHYVQSEKSGSVDFGFSGSAMSLFPQIEGPLSPPRNVTECVANYDAFSQLPGFDIFIATSATTTADARLLLSAYGIPFKKGPRHVPKKPVGGSAALKKYRLKHKK